MPWRSLHRQVWLSRWAYAVCSYGRLAKGLEQCRDKLQAAQRANKRSKLEQRLQEKRERDGLEKECVKHGVDTALYPREAPWELFPWELQLRPCAEREEQLRKATGLRNLEDLDALLADVSEVSTARPSQHLAFAARATCGLLW